VLFRNPVISMASAASFVLGMGMFGVIIYLLLYMQVVLGISATQSGNLLTPLFGGGKHPHGPDLLSCGGLSVGRVCCT
jgi:hypothetical protein